MMGNALTSLSNKKLFAGITFGRLCLWIMALLLLVTAIGLRTMPMNTASRMLVTVALLFSVFTGMAYIVSLFENHPKLLFPAVFFLLLAILWAAIGGKPPKASAFRANYVKDLSSFVGTRYVFGGETHTGVDCSGLARAAFWQSMLKEGIREFNPDLLGRSFWMFWWRDLSAQEIAAGKYGYTIYVGSADKLAGYDNSRLHSGDLAIAQNSHVLIYMGDGKWIEANPDEGKVVIHKNVANSNRPYFNTRVIFRRWWLLAENKS